MPIYGEQNGGGFWYKGGRWRMCTIDEGQWRRKDGRSWDQNNINFKTSDDGQFFEG